MHKYQKNTRRTLLQKLSASLATLDIFGQRPIFKIFKKEKFSVNAGYLCTILINFACGVVVLVGIVNMIQGTNPSVFLSQANINETPVIQFIIQPIHLAKNNSTIAFALLSPQMEFLTTMNKHFVASIQNCHRQRQFNNITQSWNVELVCVDYDVEHCQINKHFPEQYQQEIFIRTNQSYIHCINAQQWDQRAIVLQGQVMSINYQYLTITIEICQNTTTKTNCSSIEEIQKDLQNGYLFIYQTDNTINLGQMNTPITPNIITYQTAFSYLSSRLIFQANQLTTIQTDNGIVIPSYESTQALISSTYKDNSAVYNQQYFLQIIISLDVKIINYIRSYQKLQSVIGNVGGLWQAMYYLFWICLNPITNLMMNIKMANKLYYFSEGNQPQTNHINIDSNTNRNSKMQDSIFIQRKSFEVDKYYFKQFLQKRKKQIKMGMMNVIKFCFGKLDNESKIIKYTTSKISEQLDIVAIIRKLQEVEKLKMILLNEEQLNLFNYLPKPQVPLDLLDPGKEDKMIELQNMQSYKYIFQNEKSDEQRLIDAYTSYCLVNKKTQNIIDQRLLGSLDNQVLELFNLINNGQQKIDCILSDNISRISDEENQQQQK